MCAIAGIYKLNGLVDRNLIQKMINLMAHRGPDDEGYFLNENVGLGNRRLAILDLSKAGHQPMINSDGSLIIVFNGEIYNFIELKKELEAKGYRFKSKTDTEVILSAYQEWREKCLEKFNGMWAFAIWDRKKKELFCSRDRFGIKPFYYFYDGKTFAFASEIKPLLKLKNPREVNETLIYDFLRFGLLDHTNETFFKDIKKLAPACWLKIKENGGMFIRKYWNFEVSDRISTPKKNNQKDGEEFLELFRDSVKLRLRSDVPVGSCFSGGLDSSLIVCLINDLLNQGKVTNIEGKQKTFSAVFEEKYFDERKYIEEVINHNRAEKNYVFPISEGFLKELNSLIWHQEEPFGGADIYAQWAVLKKAKGKVKVLLDGQGGDENLCGYRKFYIFYLKRLLEEQKYLSFLKESLMFFSSLDVLRTLEIRKGLRYFRFGDKIQGVERLLNPQFLKKFSKSPPNYGYQRNLGKRIKEDITTWTLPLLLRYEDKNSMAFSIENRLPFLDYRLVEKAAFLPLDQKMKNGWTKVILREAMKGVVPEKIVKRKSKLGFEVPEENWFKGRLKKEVEETIKNSSFISDYVNKERLLEEFRKFLHGRTLSGSDLFFRFYILELWGRKFIYGK